MYVYQSINVRNCIAFDVLVLFMIPYLEILGCAFVRMQTKSDAEKCIVQLHNSMTLPVSDVYSIVYAIYIFHVSVTGLGSNTWGSI